MSRHAYGPARRGSQLWIQRTVNDVPEVFADHFEGPIDKPIEWLSPLETDDFAEYRDQDVLDLLGVTPSRVALSDYWPLGGPQWDALGRTASGQPILVEAKAHIAEMVSGSSKAQSLRSIEAIATSLSATQDWIHASAVQPWNGPYYQYANRLAMLHFLDRLNHVPSYLVFLYFVGDNDMRGPLDIGTWQVAIHEMKASLGISTLPPNVIDIFIDIGELKANQQK